MGARGGLLASAHSARARVLLLKSIEDVLHPRTEHTASAWPHCSYGPLPSQPARPHPATRSTPPLTRPAPLPACPPIRPPPPSARSGLEASGLRQLRELRDALLPDWRPPRLELSRSNNNLGVIYFAVCLTLGIVIPALRRSRIL